jgi:SOS-response transcriptional repressor LexA
MNITPQQRNLMLYLQRYIDANQCCPTFDEMATGVGLASKSGVSRLLDGLEARGYVQRREHMQRAISLLKRVHDPQAPAANEDTLRATLRELVETKEMKAREGDTPEYRERRERAWERARRVLAQA